MPALNGSSTDMWKRLGLACVLIALTVLVDFWSPHPVLKPSPKTQAEVIVFARHLLLAEKDLTDDLIERLPWASARVAAQQLCFPCQFTNALLTTPTFIGAEAHLGTFSFYGNVPLVNNGLCSEIAQVSLTAQNNNVAATNFTSAVLPTGPYTVSYEVDLTTAAGTSSTLPSMVVSWTSVAGVARSITIAPQNAPSGNTTASSGVMWQGIRIGSATNVQYSTSGYASNAANAMLYSLYATLWNC